MKLLLTHLVTDYAEKSTRETSRKSINALGVRRLSRMVSKVDPWHQSIDRAHAQSYFILPPTLISLTHTYYTAIS